VKITVWKKIELGNQKTIMITGDLLEVWGFKVQKRPQPEFLGTGEGGGASPPVKAPGCEPNDCHHRRAPRAGPLPLPAVRCPGPPDRTVARGQGAHLRDCHPARGIRAAVSRRSLAIWGSSGSRLPTGSKRARGDHSASLATRPAQRDHSLLSLSSGTGTENLSSGLTPILF
jgi:hypothetical protein